MFGELQKIVPYKNNPNMPHCFDILGKLIEIYDVEFSPNDFREKVFAHQNIHSPDLKINLISMYQTRMLALII